MWDKVGHGTELDVDVGWWNINVGQDGTWNKVGHWCWIWWGSGISMWDMGQSQMLMWDIDVGQDEI